jgi:hypothetical protein
MDLQSNFHVEHKTFTTPDVQIEVGSFILSQKDLPADFAKVLRENIWDLYTSDPTPRPLYDWEMY